MVKISQISSKLTFSCLAFSKLFCSLSLLLIFFGLLGMGGNVEVNAKAEEGYILPQCALATDGITCRYGGFEIGKNCKQLDGDKAFCKQKTDLAQEATRAYQLNACTGTECTDAGKKYTNCTNGICTTPPSGTTGAGLKLESAGISCEVDELSGNIGNCNKGTEKINGNIVCASYDNNTNNKKLSCKQSALTFGDNSTDNTAVFWEADGTYVFKDSKGVSVPINLDTVRNACGASIADFLIRGPILFVENIGQNLFGANFTCSKQPNFQAFKAELNKNGVKSDIVSNPGGIKLIAKSKIDVTSCTIATGADLEKEKITPKTGETWKNCSGKIILDTAEGFIDKSGTKFDKSGSLLAGTTTKEGTASVGGELLKPVGNAIGAIINIMLLVISALVFVVTYLVGWLAVGILWVFGYLFLTILRINPAGANFINVAADPWRIVVGIANMLVLSTFIFVGFGYILDIAKLKVKLEEFFLNIVVFTLVLNFTLLGSAAIVNVTQGIGEVMVGSYAIGESDPEKANFALIGGLVQGLSRVSAIRCGNVTSLTGAGVNKINEALGGADNLKTIAEKSRECNGGGTAAAAQFGNLLQAYDTTQLLGNNLTINGRQGNLITLTMLEIVFAALVIYAITIFWKAIYLVLGRTIGLWMLIVLSPLALAAYISPIQSLKKYGGQWLDHFWKWCIFYPAFIFGLILINVMSKSFADAFVEQATTLVAGQNSGGIVTNAFFGEIAGGKSTAFLIFAVVGFALPMIVFGIMIEWFAKSFEAVAKAALGGIKQGWDVFRGASGTIGAGLSGAAKLGSNTGFGKKLTNFVNDNKTIGKIGAFASKVPGIKNIGLGAQISDKSGEIAGKETEIARTSIPAEKARLEKELEELKAQRTNMEGRKANFKAGLGLGSVGNLIANAPIVAESLYADTKFRVWDNQGLNVKANQAAARKEMDLNRELDRRANATTQAEADEIDKNPNTREFKGLYGDDVVKNRAYYDNQVKAAVAQTRQGVYGTDKSKPKRKPTLDKIDYILKNFDEDISKWPPELRDSYIQAVNDIVLMSGSDSEVYNAWLGNEKGKAITRQLYDSISQEVNGTETLEKLKESTPDILPSADSQFKAGQIIGQQIVTNPNSYKVPANITSPEVLKGIASALSKEEMQKRFGDKLHTGNSLSYANKEVNRIVNKAGSALSALAIDQSGELTLEALDGVTGQVGFSNDKQIKSSIASRIKDVALSSRSDAQKEAEYAIIRDEERNNGYIREFGTDKIIASEFDAGAQEIANKPWADIDKTALAGKYKKNNPEVARLLASTNPDDKAKGQKLVRRALINALKSNTVRQDIFSQSQSNFGTLFGDGLAKGQVASGAQLLAIDQLKAATAVARNPQELRQIFENDDDDVFRNTLGNAKVSEDIRFAQTQNQTLGRDYGIQTNYFLNASAGEGAKNFSALNKAITESANGGIAETADGSGVYQFTSPTAELNGFASSGVVNMGTLANKIATQGNSKLNDIRIAKDTSNAVQNQISTYQENTRSIVKGAVSDAGKVDGDFITKGNIDLYDQVSLDPSLRVQAVSVPAQIDPATLRINNIVNFNRSSRTPDMVRLGLQLDNNGLLVNPVGEYVNPDGTSAGAFPTPLI